MLIAGETSGDLLGAELVPEIGDILADIGALPTPDYQPLHASLAPRFFGAGGPLMAAAGVDLAFDLTAHSVIGLSDVIKNYFKFRRLFQRLYRLALEREPDAIICIDFSGFNRRFAQAIRRFTRARRDWFHDWNPKIIQYVSPQVWASREGRVYGMARDYDLVLSIFPFEPAWYARRVPQLPVRFVGHPILDRYRHPPCPGGDRENSEPAAEPLVLLLPGSRGSELERHLPVLVQSLALMRASIPALRARMVLPNEALVKQAKTFALPANLEVQAGGLPEALCEAQVAVASTGTVTLECAYFGVPIVALYITSWTTFQIGKRLVNVKHLAMPNLLADTEVFPEFIQDAATPQNIAQAALDLLFDSKRRGQIKSKLAEIIKSLGEPGASRRAAREIVNLIEPRQTKAAEPTGGAAQAR